MAQLRVHTIELLVAYGKPVATLEALSDDALTELLETTVEADSAEEIQNRKIMCLHWAAERGYSVLLRSIQRAHGAASLEVRLPQSCNSTRSQSYLNQ